MERTSAIPTMQQYTLNYPNPAVAYGKTQHAAQLERNAPQQQTFEQKCLQNKKRAEETAKFFDQFKQSKPAVGNFGSFAIQQQKQPVSTAQKPQPTTQQTSEQDIKAANYYKRSMLMQKIKSTIPKQSVELGQPNLNVTDQNIVVETLPIAVVDNPRDFVQKQVQLAERQTMPSQSIDVIGLGHSLLQQQQQVQKQLDQKYPKSASNVINQQQQLYDYYKNRGQQRANPFLQPTRPASEEPQQPFQETLKQSQLSSEKQAKMQALSQRISSNAPAVAQIYKKQQISHPLDTINVFQRELNKKPIDLSTGVQSLTDLASLMQQSSVSKKRNCFLEADTDQYQTIGSNQIPAEIEVEDLRQYATPRKALDLNALDITNNEVTANEQEESIVQTGSTMRKSFLLMKLHDQSGFQPRLSFRRSESKQTIETDFGKNLADFKQIKLKLFQQQFTDIKQKGSVTMLQAQDDDDINQLGKNEGFRPEIDAQVQFDQKELEEQAKQNQKLFEQREQEKLMAEHELFDSQINYMSVSRQGKLNLKNRIYRPGTQVQSQFISQSRLLELDPSRVEQYARNLMDNTIRQLSNGRHLVSSQDV